MDEDIKEPEPEVSLVKQGESSGGLKLKLKIKPRPKEERPAAEPVIMQGEPMILQGGGGGVEQYPAEEQDPTLYCYCRQPAVEGVLMVSCEACSDWFHPACVGLTEEEASTLPTWLCAGCGPGSGEGLPTSLALAVGPIAQPPQQPKVKARKSAKWLARVEAPTDRAGPLFPSRYVPQEGDEVVYLRGSHEACLRLHPDLYADSGPRTPPFMLEPGLESVVEGRVLHVGYEWSALGSVTMVLTLALYGDPAGSGMGMQRALQCQVGFRPNAQAATPFLVHKARYQQSLSQEWSLDEPVMARGQDGKLAEAVIVAIDEYDLASPQSIEVAFIHQTAVSSNVHVAPWDLEPRVEAQQDMSDDDDSSGGRLRQRRRKSGPGATSVVPTMPLDEINDALTAVDDAIEDRAAAPFVEAVTDRVAPG